VSILEFGLVTPQAAAYHQALAQVYDAWATVLEKDPKAALADRLALVERGLAHDRENAALLAKLLAVSKLSGAEADKARTAFQTLLAEGKSPAVLHLIMGVDAWQRGKAAEGKQHLEQAYRHYPQSTVVVNNLAWMLAREQPADLPRALALIDSALEHAPGQPRFRDTRGHILVKMGRWQEAVTDLEAALQAIPNKRE
jgi:predicted Zn-dependent protease